MSTLKFLIKNYPLAHILPQDAHDLTSQADKVQPPLPQMPDGLHNQPDESEVRNSQHSEIQQGSNTGSLDRSKLLRSLIKSFPFSTLIRQPRAAISVRILNYDMFFRWLY